MIHVCSAISHEPSRRQSTRPVRDYGCARCRRHGEVYRARDTRLDRTVAIKVLAAHVASDPQFRERFEREAKAISQLNHAHICALHDVGSQDGVDFLVMEYVDGETLAARLARGALPLDDALATAIQIASALDKAHRAGIVHRDLKPGNVMLVKSGAKLLDFGLAKTVAPVMGGAGQSMLPTTHRVCRSPPGAGERRVRQFAYQGLRRRARRPTIQ